MAKACIVVCFVAFIVPCSYLFNLYKYLNDVETTDDDTDLNKYANDSTLLVIFRKDSLDNTDHAVRLFLDWTNHIKPMYRYTNEFN